MSESSEPNAPVDSLLPTSLMYLFATTWLPTKGNPSTIDTPFGVVDRWSGCANFVKCALLELQDRGLVALELVKSGDPGMVVLGGASNVRVHPTDSTERLPGLEGRLLDASRHARPAEMGLDRVLESASGDDHRGIRTLLREAQTMQSYRHCWDAIVNPLYTQIDQCGLADYTGRIHKRMTVVDPDRVALLRPAFDATRTRLRELDHANAELAQAIVGDGLVFIQANTDRST